MDIEPKICVAGDDDQQNSIDIEDLLSNISDEVYFRHLPPGYIFNPTDQELIVEYLDKKVNDLPLPRNKINCVKLYSYNPETLCQMFKDYCGNKEWYFFTPRNRKYMNGSRPNRAAGNGYWKATGADKEILDGEGNKVGYRKALVFYGGKAPNGVKTPWIMHEFRVENGPECDRSVDAMRLDDTVLCRIYNKMDKRKSKNNNNNNNNNPSSSSGSSKGKQPLVEEDEENEDKEDEDDDVPDNMCGASASASNTTTTTTTARSDENQLGASSSSYDNHNLPIHMIAAAPSSSAPPPTPTPHMWNQQLPNPQPQPQPNTNNIIHHHHLQMRTTTYPNLQQQLRLPGSQWQNHPFSIPPPPPPPPYEDNLQQQQQRGNNVSIRHQNNPFLHNYCHLENTTTTTTTTFEAAQVQVPPANNPSAPHNAPNLHLSYQQQHNWQAPHPSFNGNNHPYYHHNSSYSAATQPSITANNNIPYQHHNSELLEAPKPSINGNNNNNNNNHPYQQQQQNYSQAPQPSTSTNGNNTTHTTKTPAADDDDDADDENYDTNQFLA